MKQVRQKKVHQVETQMMEKQASRFATWGTGEEFIGVEHKCKDFWQS